jgi:hypothetical protein
MYIDRDNSFAVLRRPELCEQRSIPLHTSFLYSIYLSTYLIISIILINPLLHTLHVTQQMHSSPRLLAAVRRQPTTLPAHAATSTRLKKPALSLDQVRKLFTLIIIISILVRLESAICLLQLEGWCIYWEMLRLNKKR